MVSPGHINSTAVNAHTEDSSGQKFTKQVVTNKANARDMRNMRWNIAGFEVELTLKMMVSHIMKKMQHKHRNAERFVMREVLVSMKWASCARFAKGSGRNSRNLGSCMTPDAISVQRLYPAPQHSQI